MVSSDFYIQVESPERLGQFKNHSDEPSLTFQFKKKNLKKSQIRAIFTWFPVS